MKRIPAAASACGFSMVEALVALVVLGVGMLGIASLYVTTLRSSGSAISRMQAVNLASDLGDRIRANPLAGTAYEINGAAPEPAEKCIGKDKDCSPQEMAAHDLYYWQEQIEQTLGPTGAGTVDVDENTPVIGMRRYTITVSWKEPGEDEDLFYEMEVEL